MQFGNSNLSLDLLKVLNKFKPFLPKLDIQVSQYCDINFVNLVFGETSDFISGNIATGIDKNINIAFGKAASELAERLAARENRERFIGNSIQRTDGFAAFPTTHTNSQGLARENAFSEAFERYVWASWWDNDTISFESIDLNSNTNETTSQFAQKMMRECNIDSYKLIRPVTKNYREYETIIVLSKIKGGGYLTGGAAAKIEDRAQTIFRAMSELIRHHLAFDKMLKLTDNTNMTFYEKRVQIFGSGSQNSIVEQRLNAKGYNELTLPKIEFDILLEHRFSDLFHVHRVLFNNQPQFIGGELARLCF